MNDKKEDNNNFHINTLYDAQLTSVVEDSEEVEGDVSMLLSRYFLFMARLHHAFQLA
jgi:hypothetical protein